MKQKKKTFVIKVSFFAILITKLFIHKKDNKKEFTSKMKVNSWPFR